MSKGIKNGLCFADTMHKRLIPRVNQFVYKIYYLCFPLSQRTNLKSAFLSLNRFNLLSFYDKDHGARDGSDIEAWIRNILQNEGIKEADGEIVLLTYPRILGYIFNPVSFWFCLDKAGNLRAVLSEVTNTFKEHHNYLISHKDNRPISKDEWLEANKMFHVSPFMQVKGHYKFRFSYSEEKVGVWIDYFTDQGEMLKTSVIGKRLDLTSFSALKAFLQIPIVTLKTIFLIHFQAGKLFTKGVKYITKPNPPDKGMTR